MRHIETGYLQKGINKLVVILGLVVLLIIVGGGAAAFLLLAGGDDGGDVTSVDGGGAEGGADGGGSGSGDDASGGSGGGDSSQAVFFPIEPPIVVNVDKYGQIGFLQVSISVMSLNPETLERVNKHSPMIRNNMILMFNGLKAENVMGKENQERLQKEVQEEINRILTDHTGKGGVDGVFFTTFVIQ